MPSCILNRSMKWLVFMRDGLVCGELTRAEATKEKILKLALNV